MTISYTLQPVPDWYFADLTGRPLAGGQMFTYSSLNPNQFKPVFQDPGGVNEYPNPIIFNENGMAPGPFYWLLDSTDPDDLYFIQIFDNQGNLVFSINQYPISGGGGGGTINTVQKIENVFSNSSFISNIGSTTTQPIADQTFLAPGSHSGLYYPDIKFIQSGVSNAQDTVSFPQFGLGINPLAPDFAPAYYLNYTCSNNPSGETLKGIRIPISPYVNTIANQIFTITLQARSNGGGANTLNIQLRQYFGTGGSPSPDQVVVLTGIPITLTGSFALYSVNFSVPSVATKTAGDSNDDGTYIEILLPLSQACNIDIAKPALYVGSTFPTTLYESVEEIETELETPRTGDVRISMNAFSNSPIQGGWIPLNDGTIGNSSSNATTRAQPDSWLLYNLIWQNTLATYCPLYTSGGVATTKGGTAVSDWNANKQIQLPLTVDKVIANKGANGYAPVNQAYTAVAVTDILTVSSTAGFRTGYPVSLSGGAAPQPLSNTTIYFAIVLSATTMKLAFSAENAIAGSAIDLTANGNGNITNPPAYLLGQPLGESQHLLSLVEMPAHTHSTDTRLIGELNTNHAAPGPGNVGSGIAYPTTVAGSSFPHNNIQPSIFYNMIIKL